MSSAARPRRRNSLDFGVNLTPMLDMIFNLLFFFVLATQIRQETAQMEVRLPSTATQSAARELTRPLAVTLDSAGKIFFNDREMVEAELALELHALAAKGQKEIFIRGDERVDYGRVVTVMDVCKRAGLGSVLLDLKSAAAGTSTKGAP
jgi:biopolymer transport protein ExbD